MGVLTGCTTTDAAMVVIGDTTVGVLKVVTGVWRYNQGCHRYNCWNGAARCRYNSSAGAVSSAGADVSHGSLETT